MARFDVYRLPGRGAPLVIDVQADILRDLATRVVVPLAPQATASRERLPRLRPVFRINGTDYVFTPLNIAAVSTQILRDPVANVESEYRDQVTAALDFLFQGF